MEWNMVDMLLLLIVVCSVANGWRRGFLLGSFEVLGWVVGMLLALRLYQPLARWLAPRASWAEAWDQPAAFVLLAIGGMLAVSLARYVLLRRVPREMHRRSDNRLLGTLPGLVNGLISSAILATVLIALPLPQNISAAVRKSRLANTMATFTSSTGAAITPIFDEAIAHSLTIRTIHPDSEELVELPFTVASAEARPDLEAEMLALINEERAAEGLGALEADPELTEVARAHSADMLARGYFSHNTPEGLSPFDRIQQAGVPYVVAGENLALAPTLTLAHSGLMNSPGHRANILRPQFGRVGIGILDTGIRGIMVTQNFRN
jgi:uncharacterized protein YkwD